MATNSAGSKPVSLASANLSRLSPGIPVPRYDRSRLVHSIVHIGVGGFFRAHQTVYLDDLIQKSGSMDWGICGIGLLKHDRKMYDAMRTQDCLYTVVERGGDGDKPRVIGSMTGFLFAPDDPEAVIEKMASPVCRIVTMTITEGGYYVNSGTGAFDAEHPDIKHDLADPAHPCCVFGYLALALERRKARGLGPFTLMSCDNMQNNGDVLKKMLLAFLNLRNRELGIWLAEKGAFPNSMVDRITPVTTDDHRAMVRDTFGIDDAWPVVPEPFRQWVIEDHFVEGRPRWEDVGAQMVSNVLPYEKMKLRLLNASHQALCYIGMLVGHDYVHQTMEDPRIRKLVRTMMDVEVTPLLPPVPGIDLDEYKATLIERFANPAIMDQLSRIGTEGSARIPKFILPSVNDQLARGGPVKIAAFTVAAWFRYLTGVDDAGKKLPIIEPMEAKLCPLAKKGGADPRPMLAVHELFGDLDKSAVFVAEVESALKSFYEKGAVATLESYTK
jgi:mannitol 2-dehydrogenase